MQFEKNNSPGLPLLRPGLIPRVAAAHGLVGYGNCSLSIPMAVLAAGGIEVCPFPSSLLSTHTAFKDFRMMDTSAVLPDFLDHWENIGVKMDGLYTGFLGTEGQIDLIHDFCRRFPGCYRVIDPVMGDAGKAYATYSGPMRAKMRTLLPLADVLLPNLTEAAMLTDQPYKGQAISEAEGRNLAERLLDMGPGLVILKGMQRGNSVLNAVIGRDLPYTEVESKLYPTSLYGTGDLFASAVTAALFSGHGLEEAVAFAADLVYAAILLSLRQPGYKERGVSFEPLLGRVADFCRREDLAPKAGE